MPNSFDTRERRRSPRILHAVPLLVRCPDSPCTFAGNLKTVEVSHHGCMINAPRPFPRGTELRLNILHGHRTVTARVVHSYPIGTGMFHTQWTVALELDQPEDIWMVSPPSSEWPKVSEQPRHREHPSVGSNRKSHHEGRS